MFLVCKHSHQLFGFLRNIIVFTALKFHFRKAEQFFLYAIIICLCSAGGIPSDNDERVGYCSSMLEEGLMRGLETEDMWFDPLFTVIKGMQDKQMEMLEAIRLFTEMGLNSTGGLSNSSNGMPKHVRPIMDSTLIAMAMMQGLTSAIVNPCDRRLMETIKSCDIIKNNNLYADSYLEI